MSPQIVVHPKKNQKLPDIVWQRFRLPISRRTVIMGILNRTPDSFSDGGLFMDEKEAIEHACAMAEKGADIIDIGGESTRPGADEVSIEEELERTIPIIKKLSARLKVPISIDTSKAEVAKEALKNGASIVNDITGLRKDSAMAKVVAKFDVPVVVMHIKGTPRTMQLSPAYDDLISEIIENLEESIDIAKNSGVDENKIIVDPGIGFGKTAEHNLCIINELHRFKVLGKPIMVGLSRKSFIGKVLDLEVDKRLLGTAACTALAIANGANIIRVHDVAAMREVAQMASAVLSMNQKES